MSHTPGHWVVNSKNEIDAIDPETGNFEWCITEVIRECGPGECGPANARLIAASPELLEACKAFMAVRANYGGGFDEAFDGDEDFCLAMEAIELAINKATEGQP